VQSIQPSGSSSQKLELISSEGEVISAYIKNGNNGIKAGSRLRDVNIVQKNSTYGKYHLIDRYEVAA
jgi:hypothetical protein